MHILFRFFLVSPSSPLSSNSIYYIKKILVKQHVCWINTQFCVYFWLNKKKATKEITSKAKTTAFFLPRGLFPRLTLLLSCAFCCCLRCSECVGFCFGANAGNGVDCRRIIINKQHSLTHTRILCVFSSLLYSLRICFGHTVLFVCCWARTNTMMQCRIERKKKFLPKMLFFFAFVALLYLVRRLRTAATRHQQRDVEFGRWKIFWRLHTVFAMKIDDLLGNNAVFQ